MNIIPLINNFTNEFNETFKSDISPLNLENKIRDLSDNFSINLYQEFINFLNDRFKNSKERKEKYYIKETTTKTLITSIGIIHVNSTSYYSKDTHERYVFIRDLLNLQPYQRLTNEAEYQLVKHSMEFNMTQAGKIALRNTIISRSTVSKKLAKLNGSIHENISRCNNQSDVLYIEMDEIHANLQKNGNKICPCSIVHEGHEENFVKRKKLKNVRNFASAKLSYEQLWEVIFDYVDKKYDINKFKSIFISGDGAPGIKNFQNCFPNASFVLDKFHYLKALNYIFKKESTITKLADEYLRAKMIDEFKLLVNVQIEKYPKQKDYMLQKQNYLINNIDGIIEQHNKSYSCPCAMEGHVSQAYARYITSSPFAFSLTGLNNKLKLLVYKANKTDFTIEDFYSLKFGSDEYLDIISNINKITNIKYDQNLSINHSLDYDINVSIPIFDNNSDNINFKNLISFNNEIPFIINMNDEYKLYI